MCASVVPPPFVPVHQSGLVSWKNLVDSRWRVFLKRFLHELEGASLALMVSISSDVLKPYTVSAWKAATEHLPFKLPDCSLAGIGIYHLVRHVAAQAGRAAPGPLFVPALGRLAILLPMSVRWPATLSQPSENYASWPNKDFFHSRLAAVCDAAEVVSAYTLQLSVEILSCHPDQDPEELAERCFHTLDFVARLVADLTAACTARERPLRRSDWDPILRKFLGQHGLLPPKPARERDPPVAGSNFVQTKLAPEPSPLHVAFGASRHLPVQIASSLAKLETDHNLGPCVSWTET
jgi:hypothetical protein